MAIDALEFPELHDESIPYMAFVKNCAKLLAAAGVRDFSMQVRDLLLLACSRSCTRIMRITLTPVGHCNGLKLAVKDDRAVHVPCAQDICKPDPGRLRRNLSAIINFAKFREEKLAPYVEAQEEADVLLDAQAALEEANARLVRTCRSSVTAGTTDSVAWVRDGGMLQARSLCVRCMQAEELRQLQEERDAQKEVRPSAGTSQLSWRAHMHWTAYWTGWGMHGQQSSSSWIIQHLRLQS